MKLTKRTIDGFRYRGGWDVRWDDAVPGLGVRVYPSGKKTFVLSYRANSRKRLMVLGRFGVDMTLDEARDDAGTKKREARMGLDPLDEKRRKAQGETFDDLIRVYLDKHAKPHKKTWKTDEDRLKRHTPPRWRRQPVSQIKRADVRDLHAAIGETRPYEANRCLDLLRVMFRFARLEGFVEPGWDNPAEGVRKFKEEKRTRWLAPDELPYLAKAIDEEANIYVRSALWLYLLTGTRRNELLSVRWIDIDFERGGIYLTETKSGQAQWVPLSGAATAIIQATPRIAGNPYLLPGLKPGKALVNINKSWCRVRDRATLLRWAESEDSAVASLITELVRTLKQSPTVPQIMATAAEKNIDLPIGLRDVRLHDLRRSVGSWLTQSGIDLNIIRDGLRHRNVGTTLTYARLGRDAAKEAFEAHGRRVLEIAGKARPTEVAGG